MEPTTTITVPTRAEATRAEIDLENAQQTERDLYRIYSHAESIAAIARRDVKWGGAAKRDRANAEAQHAYDEWQAAKAKLADEKVRCEAIIKAYANRPRELSNKPFSSRENTRGPGRYGRR